MNDNQTKQPNHCIACSVCNCEHHCKGKDYCCLETVKIGTHENNPTVCKCVDCESFILDKSAENQSK